MSFASLRKRDSENTYCGYAIVVFRFLPNELNCVFKNAFPLERFVSGIKLLNHVRSQKSCFEYNLVQEIDEFAQPPPSIIYAIDFQSVTGTLK